MPSFPAPLPAPPRASVYVHRTASPADALLSPFILDPSSVTLRDARTPTEHAATFLRTPASAFVSPSRDAALQAALYMSGLRHPNVQQLLGAVIDARAPLHLLVCQCVSGSPLPDLAASQRRAGKKGPATLSLQDVARVAVDVARALLYLHATTGAGHPSLCSHAVSFDPQLSKAVLLLAAPCAHCATVRRAPSRTRDVATLAAIVVSLLDMCSSAENERVPDALTKMLARCAGSSKAKPLPEMADLCCCLTTFLDECSGR